MGVNKVILVGRLGKDPELRYTGSQTPVCNFSLATGERRKDQQGNWVEHTEWHNVVVFGRSGENCSNFLKKGREVFIDGRIQTRKWQDKEGKDRYTTEVVANQVQFLGGKDSSEGYSSDSSSGRDNSSPLDELPSADQVAASSQSGSDMSFDEDDIPF